MRQTVATGASPMDNASGHFGKESPGQAGLELPPIEEGPREHCRSRSASRPVRESVASSEAVPELPSQVPPASTALEETFSALGVGFEEVGFVVDESERAAARRGRDLAVRVLAKSAAEILGVASVEALVSSALEEVDVVHVWLSDGRRARLLGVRAAP